MLLNAGASATNINILQRRPVGLHPRHLDRRQRLHRGAAEGAEPAVRAAPTQLKRGDAGRRRDLRGCAAGAARGDRERDARDPEDLRLLQGDRRRPIASTASCSAAARRAPKASPKLLRRALRRAGRAVRSVQEGGLRRQEVPGRSTPTTSRRRRRWRWASRCAGWATDDSHQPARRRARARAQGGIADSGGAARHRRRGTDHPARTAALHRLVVLVAAAGIDPRSTKTSARAESETQQLRSVLAQVQKFEAQRALLQQRVTLIEQLRKGQTAPVHLLDEISKSLPDRLWLSELTQTGGDFAIERRDRLADRASRTSSRTWKRASGSRSRSRSSTARSTPDPKAGDLIKFQVKAQFVDPDGTARAAGGGQAGRRARPRRIAQRNAGSDGTDSHQDRDRCNCH